MPAAAPTAPLSHPAPHRHKVGKTTQIAAVWAGPVAWATQLVASYALATHPCFPGAVARTQALPGWHGSWAVLLAINVVAAVVALAAAVLALRHWRSTREEAAGEAPHAIEAGEGRTRFLALCGIMTGFGFLAAIAVTTIALFTVPQCTG